MPKRIPRWLAAESQRHPLMTLMIVMVIIILPGYIAFESQQAALRHEQQCGEDFANAWYDAQVPVRTAQDQLNAATSIIWENTQVILTQTATPEDYKALRQSIRARNKLWRHLVSTQEKHPIPPPPDQFC